MSPLKILIVGAGIGELEALQRAIHLSGTHCAVAAGSANTVIDATPPPPTEKMILECSANYTNTYAPIIEQKYKEPWRKGRPLK
jgi:hypothetical protein